MSPSQLFARKKWISLYPQDGLPLEFGILFDVSIRDVDDLRKAIKKEAPDVLRDVSAAKLQLEYPSGTVLDSDYELIGIKEGGNKKSDSIIARLPPNTSGKHNHISDD